jgi:hypothetical protein
MKDLVQLLLDPDIDPTRILEFNHESIIDAIWLLPEDKQVSLLLALKVLRI